jgi:hypothetical protein
VSQLNSRVFCALLILALMPRQWIFPASRWALLRHARGGYPFSSPHYVTQNEMSPSTTRAPRPFKSWAVLSSISLSSFSLRCSARGAASCLFASGDM